MEYHQPDPREEDPNGDQRHSSGDTSAYSKHDDS